MPNLIWNMMMSVSGGWFFVVASEAITVYGPEHHAAGRRLLYRRGDRRSAISVAVGYAVLTMLVVILAYDQLFFRPLLSWSAKFKPASDRQRPSPTGPGS